MDFAFISLIRHLTYHNAACRAASARSKLGDMASKHKVGASNQPIEILDSDDETNAVGLSSFIDLTEEDLILPKPQPILQQSADKEKNSSPISPHFHSQHQPKPLLHQSISVKGQSLPPIYKNEGTVSAISSSPTIQRLQPNSDDLMVLSQRLTSEEHADSKLLDAIDRPVRHRPRRDRERNSDETSFSLPTSRAVTLRTPTSEHTNLEAKVAQNGEI